MSYLTDATREQALAGLFLLLYLPALGYAFWTWLRMKQDNALLRDKLRAAYADLRSAKKDGRFRPASTWAAENGLKLVKAGDGVRWSLPLDSSLTQSDYVRWSVVFGANNTGNEYANEEHALSFLSGRLADARKTLS